MPSQERRRPGEKLSDAERLGDVVVGAQLQAADDVFLLPLRREHEDRHLQPAAPHLAAKVEAELKAAGFRVETDARNEKMNAKIRDLANQKIPYILVFGDKEEAAGAVSVRTRGKGDQGSIPLTDFIAKAKGLVASKSTEL